MDRLEAEVASIAGRLNAAHAELVAATARLIEDELWAGSGIMSPEHWLVLRAGLSPARARDITRIARRREQLPSTRAALDDGQLSVDQAAVVAKYAPSSHEASITELAVNATLPQLRRTLSRYQFGEVAPATAGPDETPSPEPLLAGTPAWAAAAPELSTSYHEGRFQLSYSAPADIGALVEQALREAKDSLFQAGQEQVSVADGLAEMANRSLSTITATSRVSKYRVYIHLSTIGGWVSGRGAIPPSLAAKFACDGVIQPLWETDGRPVSMGRDQRIVPHADTPAHRGPRPRLSVPGMHRHPARRGPPPRPLGQGRQHRLRPDAQPLSVPPRRAPPRRVHHDRRPDEQSRGGLQEPSWIEDPGGSSQRFGAAGLLPGPGCRQRGRLEHRTRLRSSPGRPPLPGTDRRGPAQQVRRLPTEPAGTPRRRPS